VFGDRCVAGCSLRVYSVAGDRCVLGCRMRVYSEAGLQVCSGVQNENL
jgi:hypothetical protein